MITRPEESYRLLCVVVCDIKTSRMRKPWPALGSSTIGNKKVEDSVPKNTEEHGMGLFQGSSTIAE
jgi:hypothetical protein